MAKRKPATRSKSQADGSNASGDMSSTRQAAPGADVRSAASSSSSTTAISGWTGLRYLEEWTEIAKSVRHRHGLLRDRRAAGARRQVAAARQDPDPHGRRGDASHTKAAFLEADEGSGPRASSTQSLEDEKTTNPFLDGVPGDRRGARSRARSSAASTTKDKFHAKAYITHAKLEVVGSQALVGSSNFTRPGLTQNIELNIQVQSGREVAQLQEWFEEHWKRGAATSRRDVLEVDRAPRPRVLARSRSTRRRCTSSSAATSSRPASGTRRARRCSRSSTATSRRRTGR